MTRSKGLISTEKLFIRNIHVEYPRALAGQKLSTRLTFSKSRSNFNGKILTHEILMLNTKALALVVQKLLARFEFWR